MCFYLFIDSLKRIIVVVITMGISRFSVTSVAQFCSEPSVNRFNVDASLAHDRAEACLYLENHFLLYSE